MSTAVTFDVNVLVGAVVEGNTTFWSWPSPPPVGPFPKAHCLGIINDAEEFSLWLSSHILTNVGRVLADAEDGYGWSEERVEEYIAVLIELARASGGDVLEPDMMIADCVADHEDNRILELALTSGSVLIVSSDRHLLDMSPWRGIPVIEPADFVGRVDVMRRRRPNRR